MWRVVERQRLSAKYAGMAMLATMRNLLQARRVFGKTQAWRLAMYIHPLLCLHLTPQALLHVAR